MPNSLGQYDSQKLKEAQERITFARTFRTNFVGRPAGAEPTLEMTWKDTGCDVHPKCLECPLPECKYDDWEGYKKWKRDNAYT